MAQTPPAATPPYRTVHVHLSVSLCCSYADLQLTLQRFCVRCRLDHSIIARRQSLVPFLSMTLLLLLLLVYYYYYYYHALLLIFDLSFYSFFIRVTMTPFKSLLPHKKIIYRRGRYIIKKNCCSWLKWRDKLLAAGKWMAFWLAWTRGQGVELMVVSYAGWIWFFFLSLSLRSLGARGRNEVTKRAGAPGAAVFWWF